MAVAEVDVDDEEDEVDPDVASPEGWAEESVVVKRESPDANSSIVSSTARASSSIPRPINFSIVAWLNFRRGFNRPALRLLSLPASAWEIAPCSSR